MKLCFGVVFITLYNVGEATSKCKMAGCVLIKESVVEKKSGLSDRRGIWNESNLAEEGRTLVHIYKLTEQFFVLLGFNLGNFAIFKFDREIVEITVCDDSYCVNVYDYTTKDVVIEDMYFERLTELVEYVGNMYFDEREDEE